MTNTRYSKFRFILAGILFFLSFQISVVAFTFAGLSESVNPFVHRGIKGRIDSLEKDFIQQGLKPGFRTEDFDKALVSLKNEQVAVEAGQTFGWVDKKLESFTIFLCFLTALLYFVNVFLLLRKKPIFDVSFKISIVFFISFLISMFVYISNQLSHVFDFLDSYIRTGNMINGINLPLQPHMNIFTSPFLFIMPVTYILIVVAIPYCLYSWIIKREQI